MRLVCSIICAAGFILAAAGAAWGEWPERGITLVTSNPPTVAWSQEVLDTRAEILKTLTPRLSRELGVPVNLLFRPEGSGVLAGNMVAGAKPDGYVLGALGGDTAMARVIQEYTPYYWSEFVPVSTAWRTIYALVARSDEGAADLRGIAAKKSPQKPRLAHLGLEPIEAPTLLALRAAQVAGFSWELKKVEALSPDYLLNNEADMMILPLGSLAGYPERDKLKIVTVFTNNRSVPCVKGLPTPASQELEMELNPPFAFYLPSKVNWRIRSRLSMAINRALQQPGVTRAIHEACLEPFLEDIDGVSAVLNQEYRQQENLLNALRDLR